MKHPQITDARDRVWRSILGSLILFCLFAISACGGNNHTVRVYDNARVLNAHRVQKAANNLPNDVDVYTTNTFSGTKYDFQRAVNTVLGNNPNRIVMGIDTVHHYVYVAKGANVPLNNAAIAQTVNSFSANYGNGDYTKATTAALDSLNRAMPASTGSGGSAGLWAIPLGLLILLGLFLAFRSRARYAQPRPATQGPLYQPPSGTYPPTQGYTGRGSVPPAGDFPGYQRGAHGSERQTDINERMGGGGTFGTPERGSGETFGRGGNEPGRSERGGGGTFGSGGSEFGGSERGGGGTFGRGGSEFGGSERGGGGTFGRGGSEFEQGNPGNRGTT